MRTLTGSTLAETLVMMIVAGVIFLSVMDGLTLFTRLQTQRAAALVENGRASEGYYRLENLIADADSICDEAGGLVLFRSGQQGLRRYGIRFCCISLPITGIRCFARRRTYRGSKAKADNPIRFPCAFV